jgi:pimeloyl-ACP methyl ester carboxylesterase
MSDSRVTVLGDGREFGWLEMGDPQGTPIFAFHGTPGSRHEIAMDEVPIREAGLRLISVDRPGYGLSSFQRGRRLVDWPRDVTHLADHLGIDTFAVIGHSGGGPYSAVCAALLADRVTSAAIVSGVAPLADQRALESIKRSDQIQMGLSRRRSRVMRVAANLQMGVFRQWPSWTLDMMTKQFSPVDVEILNRPKVRAVMELEAERLSRTTGRAVAQDLELFTADWGFDLGAIKVPVHIWQGDADRSVPLAHALLMHEAIPGSVLHEMPGAGHFFIFDELPGIGFALKES